MYLYIWKIVNDAMIIVAGINSALNYLPSWTAKTSEMPSSKEKSLESQTS